MAVTLSDITEARDHALHIHRKWKQEIIVADLVANDQWHIMWPDKTVEESEPLVENIYSQALEDKTNAAGAMLPAMFTTPRRGTRKDRAEMNAQKRKRAMLSYWDRSAVRKNLKRFYRDWYHAGAAYGIPWTNWDADPANRFPFFMLINPRTAYPLGHDSAGRLTTGMVMRQRRLTDLKADWGATHPALLAMLARREQSGAEVKFLEEIWWFDQSQWAVAVADSVLPAYWQGSTFAPHVGSGTVETEWLTSPAAHGLQLCPMKEAARVSVDDVPRGALMDVIPNLRTAQNFMASLLNDLQMNIHAPVVLEGIQNTEEYGLGAVLIGDGQGNASIKRDRPPVNFEAQQTIQNILDRTRNQAMEPAQRSGDAGASIVSAKGTNALMGSFNAELAASQFDIETLIAELTSATANFDEVWCPGQKTILGIDDASRQFVETYDPATTFGGDYQVRVTYGDRTGLDDQNHLIRLATMRNLEAISLRTFMEKANITEDPLHEETDMAIEALTGMFLTQLLPQQVQAGDLTALQKFIDKIDTDKMSVRAAVMETIRESTSIAPGDGSEPGPNGQRADILRMVRSLDRGGIPGNAEGQPPSQVGLAPAVRRGLAQIGPGGTAT